ncbi:PREDICTED: WSC domain-containing protein 1-like isoform X2 [Priapulus caudatus]|uniref:WSC domain-containing protein 1-like isoform X2 n=1 Tax=Priapulus caudatus TaxID=37621 RepID=A0ABM1ETW8_PRICU|nr:PREDICTED: WSC domain-containing protein 1-like isoform X2 [Priapulus caudatus]
MLNRPATETSLGTPCGRHLCPRKSAILPVSSTEGTEPLKCCRKHVVTYDLRCQVRLAPPKTFPPVALASFPGSGNTWTRHLIELLTGYFTGSIYNDAPSYFKGFIGEMENSTAGTTVVEKTHGYGVNTVHMYQKVILLVRNPYDAAVSAYNRKLMLDATRSAPEKAFSEKGWRRASRRLVLKWRTLNLSWLSHAKQLLVVYYEDMLVDTSAQLRRIVDFLGVDVAPNGLRCVAEFREGRFRRKKSKNLREVAFASLADSDVLDVAREAMGGVAFAMREHGHRAVPALWAVIREETEHAVYGNETTV